MNTITNTIAPAELHRGDIIRFRDRRYAVCLVDRNRSGRFPVSAWCQDIRSGHRTAIGFAANEWATVEVR